MTPTHQIIVTINPSHPHTSATLSSKMPLNNAINTFDMFKESCKGAKSDILIELYDTTTDLIDLSYLYNYSAHEANS
jgi:hypothetical protein